MDVRGNRTRIALLGAAVAALVAGVGAGVQVVLSPSENTSTTSAAPEPATTGDPGMVTLPTDSPDASSSSDATNSTTTSTRTSSSRGAGSTKASRKKPSATTTTKKATAKPKPKPKPKPKRTTPPVSGAGSSTAAKVISLTNAERKKNGCSSLRADSKLTKAAQGHSNDMARNNYFSHTSQDGRSPFDRMKQAGYRFSTAAENIAAGQPSASSVVSGWMNSPGHRANILNCSLTQIGVGYAKGGSYGTYWTQNFGRPA